MRRVALIVAVMAAGVPGLAPGPASAADETLILFAAGSLKSALGDVVARYEEETGGAVETAFGPSGLMRKRIEAGETAHVFASANMAHPRALKEAGRAGKVAMFARNRLCALAQGDVEVTSDTLLARLLDAEVRVGTSTPKSDPAGDYAFALFARAEGVTPGAQATLEEKALKLTGGPDSAKPPEGRNPYGWVMSEDRADIFLTYCTNALLAQREVDTLRIVQIPEEISVGADYGITVVDGAPDAADGLVEYILSPRAQEILRSQGFAPPQG